ncbi:RusA family crossover junction endodeoxyribonuclease [Acuticoccus sp. M5D2P5]|nr:RusA family crossover junction endodeoxyribonuclease [Acuticoccus kalidii]
MTDAAKDWKAHALWHVKSQRLPVVSGSIVLIFGFERSAAMRSADVDNRIKFATDALVSAGVIPDDKHVVGVAASWLPPANGLAHCLVMRAHEADFTFQPSPDGACGGWLYSAPQLMETA